MKTVIGMHTFHFVFLNCLLHLLDCNFWTGIRLRYNWYLCYEHVVLLNLARTWCWWWTPCRTQSLTEAGYTRRVFDLIWYSLEHSTLWQCMVLFGSIRRSGVWHYKLSGSLGENLKETNYLSVSLLIWRFPSHGLTMSHILSLTESVTIQIKFFAVCFLNLFLWVESSDNL